jgi:hypothetical protein
VFNAGKQEKEGIKESTKGRNRERKKLKEEISSNEREKKK